jgi:hypothetical protein
MLKLIWAGKRVTLIDCENTWADASYSCKCVNVVVVTDSRSGDDYWPIAGALGNIWRG